jgi:hypothetical protein
MMAVIVINVSPPSADSRRIVVRRLDFKLLHAMVRVFSGLEIAIGTRCEGAFDKQFAMENPRSPALS